MCLRFTGTDYWVAIDLLWNSISLIQMPAKTCYLFYVFLLVFSLSGTSVRRCNRRRDIPSSNRSHGSVGKNASESDPLPLPSTPTPPPPCQVESPKLLIDSVPFYGFVCFLPCQVLRFHDKADGEIYPEAVHRGVQQSSVLLHSARRLMTTSRPPPSPLPPS